MTEEVKTIVDYSEDISQAEAAPPLPAGEYIATVRKAEVKTSAKGTEYYSVQFHIAPESFPADFAAENAPDGKVLTFNRLMAEDTQNNRYRIRKFAEALGVAVSKRVDVNEWLGTNATLVVTNKPYEGEMREEISAVKAA